MFHYFIPTMKSTFRTIRDTSAFLFYYWLGGEENLKNNNKCGLRCQESFKNNFIMSRLNNLFTRNVSIKKQKFLQRKREYFKFNSNVSRCSIHHFSAILKILEPGVSFCNFFCPTGFSIKIKFSTASISVKGICFACCFLKLRFGNGVVVSHWAFWYRNHFVVQGIIKYVRIIFSKWITGNFVANRLQGITRKGEKMSVSRIKLNVFRISVVSLGSLNERKICKE